MVRRLAKILSIIVGRMSEVREAGAEATHNRSAQKYHRANGATCQPRPAPPEKAYPAHACYGAVVHAKPELSRVWLGRQQRRTARHKATFCECATLPFFLAPVKKA